MKKLKILNRIRHSVYFLLLTYFLFIIMVMSVVFLTINTISYRAVKNDTIESHAEKIEFSFKVLEDDIERLILLQQEYINDNDLRKMSGQFSIMSDYSRMTAIENIRHHLSWTNIYSGIISDTSVYMPRINRMISSKNGLIDTTNQDMSFLLNNSSFMDNRIIEHNNQLFIIVPYYENSFTRGMPKFISYFQISEDWLIEQLDNISELNNSTVVLMQEDNNWLRTSSNTHEINETLYEYGQQMIESKKEIQTSTRGNANYTVSKYSESLNLVLYADIPEGIIMQRITIYRKFIILFSIVMFGVIIFYSHTVYKTINEPLTLLVNGMKQVEAGNLNVSIEAKRKDELGYLIKRFNMMCIRLRDTIEQVYEEKLHTRQAELKQLQYQINPHYLYNSLYMIRRMAVSEDTENIEKFAKYLGQYYEYITKIDDDRAPLAIEIEHATNYLQVQKMRFGSRIEVDIEPFNEKWNEITVPKLIIQPILENAYNHGLEGKRNGTIKLYYVESDEFLKIHVYNDGDISADEIDKINKKIQRKYTQKTIITGLMNVHRRLQIVYGRSCGVLLKKATNGIDVVIKLKKTI